MSGMRFVAAAITSYWWLIFGMRWSCFATRIWSVALAVFCVAPIAAADEEPRKLSIAIFVSSDGDRCFSPGLVRAIKHFTSQRADQINAEGGIGGRHLKLRVFDDYENAETTVANVREAVQDPSMVAMIGVPSSTRGRAVFDALGPKIRNSTLPFITEMSLDNLFGDYSTVFTMASSVRNELEVVRKMIGEGGYQRPVFVGLDDDLYSFALGEGVETIPGGPRLAGNFQVPVRNYKLDPHVAAGLATQIDAVDPDLIVLSIHSGPGASLLRELAKEGVRAPVFVLLGRISTIARGLGETTYGGPLWQIAREGVPHVYSERLRQRIWRSQEHDWIFDDMRNSDLKGWKSGSCGSLEERPKRQIFDSANRRAIGRGTQYRDMLELIVRAAKSSPTNASAFELRRHIGTQLRAFVEGRRVLKGLWRDWAFTANRTAAEDTLLVAKMPGDEAITLSPVQYRRINGKLHATPTLYASIDLINLSRVDTNDKSFDAEFYVSMKSADNRLGIDSIEFTNAYRSQAGVGKLLSIREIHSGLGNTNFPTGVRLYKVSGKFTFEPELRKYPFDTQRLSVSFQPSSTTQSFLIQPPARRQRLADAETDGWYLTEQYVGADQDIIPTIGSSLSERRIVPFYKFNATWVVERVAVDYYLRVVVPLCFILLGTYFSVFLAQSRFESIMGIQVTALLSSIALYLALPKVDTDQATLSDKIFMMTYAAVSLMIGLSVLKDNIYRKDGGGFAWVVTGLQRIVFPVVVSVLLIGMISAIDVDRGEIVEQMKEKWIAAVQHVS